MRIFDLQSPMTDLKKYFCIDIRQASRNPDRWNWNMPMILLLVLLNRQCVLNLFYFIMIFSLFFHQKTTHELVVKKIPCKAK